MCELHGEDCRCGWCSTPLRPIGKTYAHEEVVFVPAKLYKRVTYAMSYECPQCKDDGEDAIFRAPIPKQPISHSLASPSLLAQLLHQKIEMSLPFYRQEKEWENLGLVIPRRTQANWLMTAAQNWLKPIWELLKGHLLQEEFLHADETYYHVLSSEKSNTYYWLFRTIEETPHPIILFQHEQTRSGTAAQDFLRNFRGYLHCDAYSGYKQVEGITRVQCWAHVRRKFVEAMGKTTKGSLAAQGVSYCNQLFAIEQDIKLLSPEERFQSRKENTQPIMRAFFDWVKSQYVLSGSQLGKAIRYALNNEEGLLAVLLDGRCALSNNLAERSIRPTTVGRKNWNFSASEAGAQANGIVYSLVATAKENGINPTRYFEYLFEKLPNLPNLENLDCLEKFLPWAKDVQALCQ